jgi:site-specific DNA-methyltransferase (adenine-specific)
MKPYWTSRCGLVELWHGDFREVSPRFTEREGYRRGCYNGDPPYGRDTHDISRSEGNDGASRTTDLGFEHLDPATRRALAREVARLTDRWATIFSDPESAIFWRLSLLATVPFAGEEPHREEERRLLRLLHDDENVELNKVAKGVFDYNVRAEWVKVGCTPSMNANGPAEGTEPITVVHRKLTPAQNKAWQKHRYWNGGGKRGVYTYAIDRVDRNEAVSTPKPIGLISELLFDFTNPGHTVYDLTAGGGTLGAAVLLANQANPKFDPRRCVLVEVRKAACDWIVERLSAVERGTDAKSAKGGQRTIFDMAVGK